MHTGPPRVPASPGEGRIAAVCLTGAQATIVERGFPGREPSRGRGTAIGSLVSRRDPAPIRRLVAEIVRNDHRPGWFGAQDRPDVEIAGMNRKRPSETGEFP